MVNITCPSATSVLTTLQLSISGIFKVWVLTWASQADCFYPISLEIACHCYELLIYSISHCFPLLPFPSPPSPGPGGSWTMTSPWQIHFSCLCIFLPLGSCSKTSENFSYWIYAVSFACMFAQLQEFSSDYQTSYCGKPTQAQKFESCWEFNFFIQNHSCGQASFYRRLASVLEHLTLILKGKTHVSPPCRKASEDQHVCVFSLLL